MIPSLRQQFNAHFDSVRYEEYLKKIDELYPGALDFRVAETPVFIPTDFKNKMQDTCNNILELIESVEFKEITERSIPVKYHLPAESALPEMMVFDFGICINDKGGLEPQLIEMQGFPSLYAYQLMSEPITRQYAQVPPSVSSYLNGFDKKSYAQLLHDIIIGDSDPEQVILMEVMPEHQKTRIDFHCTQQLLGLSIVCISQIFSEGPRLFYMKDDRKIPIQKIYNRVIFDDLEQQPLQPGFDIKGTYDVEWIPHPNWFYRISKFTLPYIHHPYVPETYFLNELKHPVELSEYVLKPLFSFAGQGVVIDIQPEDLDAIQDPENWILQKKVTYAPVIETPDVPAKAEIRLFFFKHPKWQRHQAVHNLARLSKGLMIGTRYNQNQSWVGGTIAYFEQ